MTNSAKERKRHISTNLCMTYTQKYLYVCDESSRENEKKPKLWKENAEDRKGVKIEENRNRISQDDIASLTSPHHSGLPVCTAANTKQEVLASSFSDKSQIFSSGLCRKGNDCNRTFLHGLYLIPFYSQEMITEASNRELDFE
jgi:hypothetical protein